MKKILLIEGSNNIGGGQIMSSQIIKSLYSDYCIEIFCPSNVNDEFKSLFPQNIIFHHYKNYQYNRGKKTFLDYLKYTISFLNILLALFKLTKKYKYDLIYVQHPSLIPHITIISSLFKIPTIAHIHVVHTDKKVCKIINYCLRTKYYKKVIGVSNYALSQFNNISYKSKIIYNCISDFSFTKKDFIHSDIRIGVLGDICPSKGQALLMESLSKINNNLNIQVQFAGPIVDKDYKQDIINKYHIKTTFLGRITNIDSYLDNIDLIIIPSTCEFETFSLAMVEAWKKGRYTIASNLGGMKELVKTFLPQYQEYLLFEKNNSLDLKYKIEKYIELPTEEKNKIIHALQLIASKEFSFISFKNKIIEQVKLITK